MSSGKGFIAVDLKGIRLNVFTVFHYLCVNVGDSVAVLVDYVSRAGIAEFDLPHDVVEEFLFRHEINAAYRGRAIGAVLP